MVAIHRESLTERKIKFLYDHSRDPSFGWGVYKNNDGSLIDYEEVEARLKDQYGHNENSISAIQQEETIKQQKIEKKIWAVNWFSFLMKRIKTSQIKKRKEARNIMMRNLKQKRNIKFSVVKSKKRDIYEEIKSNINNK